ncbi:DUF2142 domain-containing protein [Clostridiales bacterium FE2011]|nr:DUF2142 domain-containing protein [Clostridiales bacterium FE2011]QTE73062.1 DUF2142 domain-containing protein [Clostridiales bacterium FE2010]
MISGCINWIKKHIVRIGLLLLASVLLAVLLEFLQIRTQPPIYENEPRVVKEAEYLDFSQAELVNATLDGDSLKTGGEGTVVTIRFQPAKHLSFLQVESKKHIRSAFPIRVYWSKDGEKFSETDVTEIQAVPESVIWTGTIPEDDYAALKIELDNKMTIRSVKCQAEVTERVPVPEQMRLWRISILIPVLFFILSVLCWFHAGSRLAASYRQAVSFLREERWKILLRICRFLLISFVAYALIRWLVSGAFFGMVNIPKHLFCVLAGLAAGALLSFPKTLAAKPERLFVLFCLLSGWMILFLFPNDLSVNWDMEYHFEQTHLYSYLGEERLTNPDAMIIFMEGNHDSFVWDERVYSQELQNQQYDLGVVMTENKGLMLNSIYEIFPAAGMYLGRLMHLSWPWTMYFAKLFNLLTAAICGFFAVRRLKSGKMILACVLLIPTNVFLASVFSYDHGVISFVSLGLSYYFAEWQEPEKKLTYRKAFVILGSMTIALLTKAFYAPVLLLTAIMPKGKWAEDVEERRQYISRKRYLLLSDVVLLISLVPYILPMLQGNIVTDMRGGSSGEPMEQIRFILANPLRYLQIMLSTLKEYFNPANSAGMLTTFGYEGTGSGWTILCALLVILALTDKKPCDRPLERKPHIRILGLFLLFISTCIIAFCLYITFTDVGLNFVNGIQHRYFLPFIFPVLMFAGSGYLAQILKIDKEWKQRLYNGSAFLVSLIILFNVIYTTCISRFT